MIVVFLCLTQYDIYVTANGIISFCLLYVCITLGLLGGSAGKESACRAGNPSLLSWGGKFPWRRDRPPTPVFLGFPGGSVSEESACSAGDLGSIPGLERAWKPTPVFSPGEFPWTEQPGGLQSAGLQRVSKTSRLSAHARAHTHARTHPTSSLSCPLSTYTACARTHTHTHTHTRMHTSHPLYPVLCPKTLRLFPCVGYYK